MTRLKTLTSGVAAVAIVVACASSALAGTITISGHPDYRAGLGGEFNVRAKDEGGAALLSALSSGYKTDGTVAGIADGTRMNAGFGGALGFQTFCVEYNEHISLPGDYTASISAGAIAGGIAGGVGNPSTDLVSVGTAYLYSQFATGGLSGYNYANGADRATSAVKLQEAIWYLEDEISLLNPAQNSFLQLVFIKFGTPDASLGVGDAAGGAKVNSNGAYGVRVLNLGTAASPNQSQDQLITVPDGGLTIALLGFGLSGLALMRRKLA